MEKNKAIKILIIIVLITVAITMYIYSSHICETRKIDTFVTVLDHIGVNVNNESLNWGMIMPGNSVTKTIQISHNCKNKALVNFEKYGNASQFVNLPKNNFILEPNTIEKLNISINIPNNIQFGNYTGKLLIKFKNW